MPKTTIGFLDLPREIRDQIYTYILISPTHHITTLYPPSSSSHSTSNTPSSKFLKRPPRSHLHITPCTPEYQHRPTVDSAAEYTLPSLSICRVSRQLHHETQNIFYTQNAYFTSHPFKSTSVYPSLIRVLKAMGQPASRKLQKVVILLPPTNSSYKFFGKTLQALSSRARHGDFKTLVLHVSSTLLNNLHFARQYYLRGVENELSRMWEGFIGAMREAGGKGCRFEREVVCPRIICEEDLDDNQDIARDINTSLGGSLLWGKVVGWVDGKLVDGDGPKFYEQNFVS